MSFDPMRDPPTQPNSYWAATAKGGPDVADLEGHIVADVAVIGAGFTGLCAALQIAEKGANVVVLDANEPGWGASGRNNGQVVAGLKHEPGQIERKFGAERGSRLIDTIGQSPDVVFSLIDKYGIECSAARNGIITAAHSKSGLRSLQHRVAVWNERDVPLEYMSKEATSQVLGTEFYHGACLDPRGGSINPLAYARGLARAAMGAGASIYKNAMVRCVRRKPSGWLVESENGTVDAGKVIIATNGHTGDLWPGLKRTILPVRTPQLVSKPVSLVRARTILPGGQTMSDTSYLTIGIRMHPDRRYHIAGGGGSPGEESEKPYDDLKRRTAKLYPWLTDIGWDYRWTGWMAMTPDRFPLLIELAPGVISMGGYSGRGIALSTTMGNELGNWAIENESGNRLAYPLASFRTLPYYALKDVIIEGAIHFFRATDKIGRLLS